MQVRVDKTGKNSEPGQIKNAIIPALPGRHDIDGQAVPNGEISIFKHPPLPSRACAVRRTDEPDLVLSQ
jgi:hypothetical protein